MTEKERDAYRSWWLENFDDEGLAEIVAALVGPRTAAEIAAVRLASPLSEGRRSG